MKRILGAALAVTAIVSLAACSDDTSPSVKSAQQDLANRATLPGGVTIPNVAGVPAECAAIVQAMANAGAAVSGQGDAAQLESTFTALEAAVPDDLKDDARTFGQAYVAFIQAMAAHASDANPMANPEVIAALQAVSTPEVQAAADNISAYMDATCPSN